MKKKIKYISLALLSMALIQTSSAVLTSCGSKEKQSVVVKENYTITFDAVGGSSVNKMEVKAGSTVSNLPTSTRSGRTFGGWYLEATYQTEFTKDTVVNEDLTLYAKWEEISIQKCTLTFNTMGGSEISPIQVEVNGKATQPSTPVKEGYTFIGWFKDENQTVPFSFDDKLTADLTIYAAWEKTEIKINYYTVSFDTAGTDAINSIRVEENQTVSEPALVPAKEDYKFLGWYESDMTTPFDFTKPITANVTVYAKFEEIQKYYVTFATDGGTAIDQQKVYINEHPTEPAVPSKKGFSFDGWYESDMTTPFDFTKALTSDVTAYAKWTALETSINVISSKPAVYDQDFTSISSLDNWTYESELGVYQSTNQLASDGSEDYTNNNVTIANGVATLNDSTEKSTRLVTDFGKDYNTGKLYVYCDITLKSSGDSWTFIQFYGDSATKTNNEVFGIRSESGILKYRFDSGSAITPSVSVTRADGNYTFLFVIDFEAQTIKVVVNNYDEFVIPITNNILSLDSFRFVSSDGGSKTMSVNQIKIAYEAADLQTVISTKTAQLDAYYNAYDLNTYTTNSTNLLNAYNQAKANVASATTPEEAISAYLAGIEAMKAIPCDSDIELFAARQAKVNALNEAYKAEDYTMNPAYEIQLQKCILAINNADLTSIETVYTQQTALMDAVLKNDAYLAKYKEDKIKELEEYKDSSLYTINASQITNILDASKTSINASETPDGVDLLVTTAKGNLDAVLSDEQVITKDKKDACDEIDAYFTSNAPEDTTSSLYTQLDALRTSGKEDVNTQTTQTDILNAKNNALNDMKDLVALSSVTVEQAITNALADLGQYATNVKSNYDETLDSALLASIDASKAEGEASINACTTNVEVANALNASKNNIDNLVKADTLAKAKKEKLTELGTYYNQVKADLEIEEAINALDLEYQNQIDIINEVATINELDQTLQACKEALDTKKLECVEIEKANRTQYEVEMLSDVTVKQKFDKVSVGATSTDIKTETTYGAFTITPGTSGKFSLKSEGVSIKSNGKISFTTTQENTILTIAYYSTSSGRTFTLDGQTYEPYTFEKVDGLNTTTIVIATAGTHTIEFDANEHKVAYCSLTTKELAKHTGYVNAIDYTVATTVAANEATSTIVSSVVLDVEVLDEIKKVEVGTGYTVVVTKDGVVVDTITESGDYEVTVYYGTSATKYNSKTVNVTITVTQAEVSE